MRIANSFVQKAKDFLELSNALRKKGYKKKEIAGSLEMPPPVFSSLFKTVFPEISKINQLKSTTEIGEEIDNAFSLVNNLSRSRISGNIDVYIKKLKKLSKTTRSETVQFDFYKNFKKHAESNYEYIKKYHEGLYYFYYVSTDSYGIKRDVFMIKPNLVSKSVECFKGNNESRVRYYGVSTMIGTHILNVHMAEKNIEPSEYIMMNLSLPSVREVDFFRGVFSSLTYTRQPIARRVVLTKISDKSDDYEFEKMDVKFYKDTEHDEIKEISKFLLSPNSKTECFMVHSPSFTLQDLEKESEIITNVDKIIE